MKNYVLLKYFLIILINCANLTKSNEELIELNCFNETHCKQFQHSGVKSWCIEEQCQCTSITGEKIRCRPLPNHKVNNIIGGPCPCQQPNADCEQQQNICYCATHYIPSTDRRRCIPKEVALGGKCELDSQCQRIDVNSICHADSKECVCMEQFINDDDKCVSVIGSKSFCTNDLQCSENYGDNTKCSNATHYCVCQTDHFASVDNSKCLKISKYLDQCSENIQCMGTMGPGGKCVDDICQCMEKYFAETTKTEDGTSKTVCTPIIKRGQYCRYTEDCYQRQLNESDQSMDCTYSECNCKLGFKSLNNLDCVRDRAASKAVMEFSFMIVVVAFVSKCF